MTDIIVGPYAAFKAGALSILSPSAWPLFPFFAAYFAASMWGWQAGAGLHVPKTGVFRENILAALGFLFIFVWIWTNETLLGRFFFATQDWFTGLGGLFFVLCGLILLKIPTPGFLKKFIAGFGGPFFSVIIGGALAFAWSPEMGPVMGTVVLLGNTQELVWRALALLAVYGAGFLAPLLILAFILSRGLRRLDYKGRLVAAARTASGAIFVVGGLLLSAGYVNKLTSWSPEIFEGWVDLLIRWGI